ncbi:MAG: mannitol dehydrogenase family protein [Armatimonadaceae bacterium]
MTNSASPVPLSAATLHRLPPQVRVPTYDRSRLIPHIVHIGVGGFHRAHQAAYLDDLLHDSDSEPYGICGVGLLPQDSRMGEVLHAQDFLYTLVTRSAVGDQARVIGSLIQYLHAPSDPQAVIERMASPETRIVSLTVTEGGYCENKTTGELDTAHPMVAHDLQNPTQPRGLYGFLTAALQRRHAADLPPFTIQSCDNLLNNGNVCRQMLLSFLDRVDPALSGWVAAQGAFPNSMVDRITPATTDTHRALVREAFGIEDAWPVVAEPFTQWVIEDHFSQGRPDWERVGAQMVDDVQPYEKMKIRLLNGSHQVMCYIGMLLGYRYAPQAMADPQIDLLIQRFMDQEATPLLPSVPGIDLTQYKQTLRQRFANPAINDQLGRIGTDGSARIPEFVLPTAHEQAQLGGPVEIAAFTVAAWIRYLNGYDDRSEEMPFADALGEPLREMARRAGPDAAPILALHELFGSELIAHTPFTDAVQRTLHDLYTHGARLTLTRCLENTA